jgi:hypothetical protein
MGSGTGSSRYTDFSWKLSKFRLEGLWFRTRLGLEPVGIAPTGKKRECGDDVSTERKIVYIIRKGGMNTIPKGFSETLSTKLKEKKGKVTNDVEKTLIQDEIPHLGHFLEDFGCFFMFTQRML